MRILYKPFEDNRISLADIKPGNLYELILGDKSYVVVAVVCEYNDTFLRIHVGKLIVVDLAKVELYELEHELHIKTHLVG